MAANPPPCVIRGERLDADDVVGALVADNFSGRNIDKPDVLRHDDMCGHVRIDVDFLLECGLGRYASDNADGTEDGSENLRFHIGCVK